MSPILAFVLGLATASMIRLLFEAKQHQLNRQALADQTDRLISEANKMVDKEHSQVMMAINQQMAKGGSVSKNMS